MSYKCYLGGVLMPETPAKLNIKIKGQNQTLTLLDEGEINFLKSPGLTEITLPLSFPVLSGSRPEYYLGLLEALKVGKRVTQFIMTRSSPAGQLLFDTNIKVSVEDYTIAENATNGLDLAVEIKLKQYRDYGTKTVKINADVNRATATSTVAVTQPKSAVTVTNERPATTSPKVAAYTVKSGDCLWSIAKKCYGNGAKYTLIYEANKSKIKNPNLIYAGQVLTIPQ